MLRGQQFGEFFVSWQKLMLEYFFLNSSKITISKSFKKQEPI